MDDTKNATKNKADTEKAENTPSGTPSRTPAKEIGGREGPDPVRYGDWENNGIASDF